MTTVRLLADDLTGALDTAAEFAALCGPVHTAWDKAPAAPSAAFDTGTREMDATAAARIVAASAPFLHGATIAFKKVDSLFRGPTLAEIAALLGTGTWSRAILAPAFPFQDRVTRAGRQWTSAGPAGPDLVPALRALGLDAHAGDPVRPGVSVLDAETDADLDALVAAIGPTAPVLWCGTGGLAAALARALSAPAHPVPTLPRPVLGLFGSDQDATARQLAACAPHWIALPDGGPASAARLAAALARDGIALASFALPEDTAREAAAARIAAALAALAPVLPPPGTLAIAGGETLRAFCTALGADALLVQGRAVPGLPVSTVHGGRWDGVTVLSKSGAFGPPTLLRELLALPERIPA